MRRPQSARRPVAVLMGLLAAFTVALPTSAAIAPVEREPVPVLAATTRQCTKWTSTLTPPKTIKVLRTAATDPPRKVKGTAQTVDFSEYVATVMAAEWPERYPIETLKAGAIATKQFAWYHLLNYRGGVKWKDGTRYCYDVVDSTVDQWYRPEKYGPGTELWPADGSKIRQAMDATWDQSLRKYRYSTGESSLFLTGYRAGSASAECGEDATGFKLFHNSTRKCGYAGLKYEEILRRYFNPRLEVVTPGVNDVIGTKHGDASAMQHAAGQRTARVWTPGQSSPATGSSAGLTLSTEDLLDYAAGDLDGDGQTDLAWLKKTGPSAALIRVALSNGTNYGEPEDWWSGDIIVPANGAQLLIGDVHADGRADVAIFGSGPSSTSSRLVVLKRKRFGNSQKLSAPILWWQASQEPAKVASVWLADLSGDGRADLVVRQNGESGGVRLKSAVTKSPLPSSFPRMGTYKVRWEDHSVIPAKVKMNVADANRDGRDDLLMLRGGGGRAVVERLQGQKLGGFKRVRIWSASKADPIPVEKTRLGTADIDYDGRSDLVLFSQRGTGTRIRVLKARDAHMRPGPDWRVGITWADIRPY